MSQSLCVQVLNLKAVHCVIQLIPLLTRISLPQTCAPNNSAQDCCNSNFISLRMKPQLSVCVCVALFYDPILGNRYGPGVSSGHTYCSNKQNQVQGSGKHSNMVSTNFAVDAVGALASIRPLPPCKIKKLNAKQSVTLG